MNWISLLLQVMTLRRSLNESRSMVDSARDFADRGKRTVTSVLLMLLGALFLFSSLLIAVIELGLEIDRGAISYSGLMVSATILLVIAGFFVLAGWLVGRVPPAPAAPPPSSPRAERLKDVLEEFLVGFVTNLSKPGQKSDQQPRQD
jgi:hypothetical protein